MRCSRSVRRVAGAGCATFRTTSKRPIAEQCLRNTKRVVARRVQHFNEEIEVHDIAMKQRVDDTAPQLVEEPGIGYVTAARFVIAWSHPGRCRSEAAYGATRRRRSDPRQLGTESGSSPIEPIRGPPTQLGLLRRGSRRSVPPRTHQPPTSLYVERRARPTARSDVVSSATSPEKSGASSSIKPRTSLLDRHRRIDSRHVIIRAASGEVCGLGTDSTPHTITLLRTAAADP